MILNAKIKACYIILIFIIFIFPTSLRPALDNDFTCRLKSGLGEVYLHGDGIDAGGNVSIHIGDVQTWYFYHMDTVHFSGIETEIYMIVNGVTGCHLTAWWDGNITQYPFLPNNSAQLWVKEAVENELGKFRFWNRGTGQYLHANNLKSGGNVRQYGKVPQYDSQKWVIMEEHRMSAATHVSEFNASITAPPRLAGSAPPTEEETAPQLSERSVIPFFLVNDQKKYLSYAQRISHSPYYVLERYQYYKLLHWIDDSESYKSGAPISYSPYKSATIMLGFTEEQSHTFSQTTGISVSASIGGEFKCVSASVSTTVSHEWGFSNTYTTSMQKQTTETLELQRMNGHVTAIWEPILKYKLKTLDDDVISVWDTTRDRLKYSYYPDESHAISEVTPVRN